MLKRFVLSGCITAGLICSSVVQSAVSQTLSDEPNLDTSYIELHHTPTSPPSLADLQSDLVQLSRQLTRLPQVASNPTPLSSSSSSVGLGSVALVSTSPLSIRVLVASDSMGLPVATETDTPILNANGEPIAVLPQSIEYTVQPTEAGIEIGDMQFPSLVQIAPDADGLVSVNGQWYRGMLTLINTGGQLLAVNNVDLEQYLYSVVGAEMPASWHDEALKSQAIAARSYALAHIENPASDWYDLGNNESYQMYKGIESEADSTYAAVAGTDGQFLIQDGRTLTALYASTDEVSNEAHSGLGMSQVGVVRLADTGFFYRDILAHYYPGGEIYQLSYN